MSETLEIIEVKQEFHIDSDKAAEWLLRELANIEAEKNRISAQANAMIADLESSRKRLMQLYEQELTNYVQKRLETAGGKSKTVKFLQGTCQFRTVPGGLRLTNPDAAFKQAIDTGFENLFESKITLNSAAYREYAQARFEEDGEIVPGMEIKPDEERFYIAFPKV